MKKIFKTGVITLALATFLGVSAYASEGFKAVSVPYPEGENLFSEDYQRFDLLRLRYSDDKRVIPLCAYYDGTFYATVPEENADKPMEVFSAEEVSFKDEGSEDTSYDFYIMKHLAAYGVIKGDANGCANPKSNVTRAEATAMVLRMMGVNIGSETESGFKDVPKDSWFAQTVATAKELGIVQGDSSTEFNPGRNVSREEMTAMVARAVWKIGLQDENKDVSAENIMEYYEVKDLNKLSKWAYSAYDLMKYYVPYDTEESTELDAEGIPKNLIYLNPQNPASRVETSEMVLRALENFQVYPTKTAIEIGFDKKMPVIDGSTSTYPFTEAIYGNLFYNGYNHKDKPKKHSKSHASYQRLINGEVDAIIASVYPGEDIVEMAKEKGVELELIPIGYDAMVFFTNIENSAEGLSSEQISEIYVDNKYSNWKEVGGPDALLYPYCRNNDSGSHAQMQKHFLNGKEINDKIRTETTSVSMSNVLTDVMGAKTDDPKGYALGYSIYYYFNNMDLFYNTKTELKLLAVDGVYPNDETIADANYPLSNNTYVVIRKSEDEGSAARKFAAFMLTELGQQCVKDAGFGPLKK